MGPEKYSDEKNISQELACFPRLRARTKIKE
jgi:hypothetical protein